MRMHRSIMREHLDFMVMVAEIFTALMVAFPLLLIVMLTIMSSIGGGIGATSPENIVPLVIYGLVPAVGIFILILIDLIAPRLM